MRDYLIDLMRSLEREIPPPAHCHHALTFAQYGSDEYGWSDRLALQINEDGVFHCVFLDDEDFDLTPAQLIGQVVASIREDFPSAQLGVSLGRYV